MQDSLQKICPSHASSSSQVQDLQKALEDTKRLNAKHQEQIETLTLERDAAESALHAQKRISSCLEEDFSRCETSLVQTSALLHTAHSLNESQRMVLRAKDKELEAKDQEIENLQLESSNQTSEIDSLTNEKLDLEDWISEIKTRVKEANTSYSNLETKVQTQNSIILQLKAENALLEHRHESDIMNHEMNKKALVRSNVDLKRSCEDLQAKLHAEQEKTKATQPTIDWKAECLKVHKRKSTEIKDLESGKEQLQVENKEQYMELRTLRTEIEQLQVQNQEQYMELRTLKNAELNVVSKHELVNSAASAAIAPTAEDELPTSETSNITSSIVTLCDAPPAKVTSEPSAVITSLQPTKTWESRAFSDLAGVVVFLGCLVSALLILGRG